MSGDERSRREGELQRVVFFFWLLTEKLMLKHMGSTVLGSASHVCGCLLSLDTWDRAVGGGAGGGPADRAGSATRFFSLRQLFHTFWHVLCNKGAAEAGRAGAWHGSHRLCA